MRQEFDVTEIDGRRTLWLDSDRLEEYLAAYRTGEYATLGINTARGYRLSDIDVVARCESINSLHIVPGVTRFSLAPIRHLSGLRSLVVSADCGELKLEYFPHLEEFRGYWHPQLLCEHKHLRVLDISGFKPKSKSLTDFPALPLLAELSLVQSNVVSLKGIDRMPAIALLELSFLGSLQTLSDAQLLPRLRQLICENCRALAGSEDVIARMSLLQVLRLNRCGPLLSLRFLEALPHLEEFRFVGTDVVDGNLSPILRLKRVGFQRRRHFSHSPEEVGAILAGRGG